ncbi:MAG TPA: 50S ribosomal protein L25 [Tepidisphaeraceae bacterium]|nr:50S ribosomal protein L25 [Tepidisphaeraceae bacterium]
MAVKAAQVNAKTRGELGSRANKKLRDQGLLPGVVYGHKEAIIPITMHRKEVVNHLNLGAHVFDLTLDGTSQKVLVKDVQYNHLGTEVIHVDLARVSLDEKVKVTVPLELKGEPKGTADGGVLQQIIKQLDVECLVLEIPEIIRHNVGEMGLNSVLHVKDIAMPHGVRVLQDGELIVATVKEVLEEVVETPAEGATAEPEVIGRKPTEEEAAAAAEGAGAAKGEAKPEAKKKE